MKDSSKRTKSELDTLVQYLRKLPLFEEIDSVQQKTESKNILNLLALNIGYQKWHQEEIVVEYQSVGSTFYIIVKGSVDVLIPEEIIKRKSVTNSINGKGRAIFQTAPEEEKVVEYKHMGRMGPGQSFGEIAWIRNTPRMARIQCIDECHFIVIK